MQNRGRSDAPSVLGLAPTAAAYAVAALLVFAATRWVRLDYDEYANAHAAWLISRGARPFVDFQAMHAPFFWFLLAPALTRLPEAFSSLIVLRALNAASAAALLGVLTALARETIPDEESRRWLPAAFAIAVLQPQVVATLAQLRPDHLSTALILAGALVLRGRRPNSVSARAAVFGALTTLGLALSPKLFLLPLMIVLARAMPPRARGENPLRFFAAAGAAAAAAAAALALESFSRGVDPRLIPRLAFAFQARLLSGFPPFELLSEMGRQIAAAPLRLGPILVFGLWGLWRARGAWRDERRDALVVGAFILVQAAWVKFPFAQYSHTLYLLWVFPLALFYDQARRVCSRRLLLVLTAALLTADGLALWSAASEGWKWGEELRAQTRLGDAMLSLAAAGRPVSAQPYADPVFRRDSTYWDWFASSYAEPDMEKILRAMPVPGFTRAFSYDGYSEQLEKNPPSLVAPNPMFAGPDYLRAVHDFVERKHKANYAEFRSGGLTFWLRRPRAAR